MVVVAGRQVSLCCACSWTGRKHPGGEGGWWGPAHPPPLPVSGAESSTHTVWMEKTGATLAPRIAGTLAGGGKGGRIVGLCL